MMGDWLRIAVMGVGLMGRQHVAAISQYDGAEIACLIDPDPATQALADSLAVKWYRSLNALEDSQLPDGIVIATPTQFHKDHVIAALSRGLPVLVEKPISDSTTAALRMIETAKKNALPLLVGYHRRHSPIAAAAKKQIEDGHLGRVVAVHGTCWLFKPDGYFNEAWRTKFGGGPIWINLVHDLDLLCYFLGKIRAVQVMVSDAVRGFDVEDTAALLLEFSSGAIGTLSVSDTIVAPWSYELTAAENKIYPTTGRSCYQIGGTHGALELPNMKLWRNRGKRGWWEAMECDLVPVQQENPLALQIKNFCDVIHGVAEPKVTGADGLLTLKILEAVNESAVRGIRVRVDCDQG